MRLAMYFAASATVALAAACGDVGDLDAVVPAPATNAHASAPTGAGDDAESIELPLVLIDDVGLSRQFDPAYDPPEPVVVADGLVVDPGMGTMWTVSHAVPDESVARAVAEVLGIAGPVHGGSDGWIVGDQAGGEPWVAIGGYGRFWFDGLPTPPASNVPCTTIPQPGTVPPGPGCGALMEPAEAPIDAATARAVGDELVAALQLDRVADLVVDVRVSGASTRLDIGFAPGGVRSDHGWQIEFWGDTVVGAWGPVHTPQPWRDVPTVGTDEITTRLTRLMSPVTTTISAGGSSVGTTTSTAVVVTSPDPLGEMPVVTNPPPTVDRAVARLVTVETLAGDQLLLPAVEVLGDVGGWTILAVDADLVTFVARPEPDSLPTTTGVDGAVPGPAGTTTTTVRPLPTTAFTTTSTTTTSL